MDYKIDVKWWLDEGEPIKFYENYKTHNLDFVKNMTVMKILD